MNENAKLSQQDADSRAQDDLTRKVGVRLTQPETSHSSWGKVKRLLRIG